MRLGELLIEAGAISEQQLAVALREQRQFGGRLGGNLVELGFLTEDTLTKILAAQLHLPRVSEAALDKVPRSVLDLVPHEIAAEFSVCPVRLDGSRLHLAMSDPLDKRAIAEVAAHTQREVRILVAADGVLRHALHVHYAVAPRAKFIQVKSGPDAIPLVDNKAATSSAPVFDGYGGVADPRLVSVGELAAPQTKRAAGVPDIAPARPSPPAPLADAFVQQLLAVKGAEDVVEVAAQYVMRDFARAALLLIRGDQLVGARVYGEGANAAALSSLNGPLASSPAITSAIAAKVPLIGRDAAATRAFDGVLGSAPQHPHLMFPIWQNGRAVACLVAIGGRSDVGASSDEYARVSAKISLGFQLLVLRKQILA